MKENIRETRLANGLTVLTDEMTGVRSATVGFFFRVGSRHEPTELNGITHFIEHMVFKGTSKRSALGIAEEQDRLGGNLDAFTTHEETSFVLKVIDSEVHRAFDLLADMLLEPRFDTPDLRSEQRVIIEEMKMIEDTPEEYLGDLFNKAFFPDHPLGLNIAGTPKTVRSFDHEVTSRFHRERFCPSNLVIAAAGNIDHCDLVEWAGGLGIGNAAKASRAVISDSPQLAAPFLVRHKRHLEQAHLILATPIVGATDERRYAADLLANIIGGGTSSRLWQTIREQRGLAYSVGSSVAMYQDCGVFSIFAATSPAHVREVVGLAIGEMKAVVSDGVTADELELAKQQARAAILLSLEDSASRAAALAQGEMVHGRQIAVEETLANLELVTAEDCRCIAREFFRPDLIAFAALGDLAGLRLTRKDIDI